jgi:ERF superfamily
MNDTGNEGQIVERVERAAPAEAFGAFLMQALADPNIPADKLEVIAKMRREVLTDQAREAFMEHYAAFSAELPQVERDGTVTLEKDGRKLGSYKFTTIEQMDTILRPLLARHGLAISFSSVDNPNGVTITGTLSGWGWERSSTYSFPPDKGPGRNELQARGSARRYGKRYITDDLCNVVRKGKDDDGKGVTIENLIDAVQVTELTDLLKATNTDQAAFLKLMVSGAESLQDIRMRDFSRLVLALKDKAQKQKERTKK